MLVKYIETANVLHGLYMDVARCYIQTHKFVQHCQVMNEYVILCSYKQLNLSDGTVKM